MSTQSSRQKNTPRSHTQTHTDSLFNHDLLRAHNPIPFSSKTLPAKLRAHAQTSHSSGEQAHHTGRARSFYINMKFTQSSRAHETCDGASRAAASMMRRARPLPRSALLGLRARATEQEWSTTSGGLFVCGRICKKRQHVKAKELSGRVLWWWNGLQIGCNWARVVTFDFGAGFLRNEPLQMFLILYDSVCLGQ